MFIYHVCTFIISPQIYSLQSASAQGRNMEMRTIQQNVDRGGRNDKIFIPSVYPQYPACLKSNFKQRWWVIRVGPCASVSGHWELTEMNSHYGMEYVTTKRFLCILSHLLNNYGEWRVSQKGNGRSIWVGLLRTWSDMTWFIFYEDNSANCVENGLTSLAGKTYRWLLQVSWWEMMGTGAKVLVGMKKGLTRRDLCELGSIVDLSMRRAEKNEGWFSLAWKNEWSIVTGA